MGSHSWPSHVTFTKYQSGMPIQQSADTIDFVPTGNFCLMSLSWFWIL